MARYSKPLRAEALGGDLDSLRALLDELGLRGDQRMTSREAEIALARARVAADAPLRERDNAQLAARSYLHDRVPIPTMYHWQVSDRGLTRDELLGDAIQDA